MSVADLMEKMMKAGAPMEAILIAVRAVEAEQNRLADTRAKAAERKRRQRERERDASVTVTGRSRDVDGTEDQSPPLPLPPNDNNSNPPAPTPPEETPRARKGRADSTEIALPDDWKPTEFGPGTKSRSIVDGWPPGTLEHQLEHFAAHHRKKGDRFKDWQAAWSTWVLNSRKFSGDTSNRRSSGQTGQPRSRDGFLNACIDEAMGGNTAGQPFGRADDAVGDDHQSTVVRLTTGRTR